MTTQSEQLSILVTTFGGFLIGTLIGHVCNMFTYHSPYEEQVFFNNIVRTFSGIGATAGFTVGGGIIFFVKLINFIIKYGSIEFFETIIKYCVPPIFFYVIYLLFFFKN